MPQQRQQPGPPPGASALYGALGDAKHGRRLGDWEVKHVNEYQGQLLVAWQLAEGRRDFDRDIAACRRVKAGLTGLDRVEQAIIAAADLRPSAAAPHLVQARVHNDAVQPRRDSRLSAEAIRASECRDHRVLQGVRGVLWVAQRADRDRPEPVSMPEKQITESVRISVDVPSQQLSIGDRGIRLSD